MEVTQSNSGALMITARVINTPLKLSVTANDTLRIRTSLVYYVNPWWTEFVTSDGTFTLADGKIFKVINN
jgi:hypothetical protein